VFHYYSTNNKLANEVGMRFIGGIKYSMLRLRGLGVIEKNIIEGLKVMPKPKDNLTGLWCF
jgi:hypothetical protein